jgi:hypothetical protein
VTPRNGVAPARAKYMSLDNVRTGKLKQPLRILLHGVPGVGKSSFAAEAPKPVFLCADNGTSDLDVARLPEPRAWEDVLEAVRVLTEDDHPYETFVIDPLNWIEPMCWTAVCREKGWSSIEEPGFMKGPTAAVDFWRALVARLERLQATRRMHVILLAHTAPRNFKNPEAEDFHRYQSGIDPLAAGLFQGWCDAVLFAKHETFTEKAGKQRARGRSTGVREMYTEWNAAFDAKNRFGLPAKLPLSWAEFHDGVERYRSPDTKTRAAELRATIGKLLAAYGDEGYAAKANAYIGAAQDDVKRLDEIENRIAARLRAKQENEGEGA